MTVSLPTPIRGVALFFYADDSVIWATGPSVPDLVLALNDALDSVARFSVEEGCPLSAKSRAFLFCRRPPRELELHAIQAARIVCGSLSLPVQREPPLPFLGVLFDTALTWLAHRNKTVTRSLDRLAAILPLTLHLSPSWLRVLYLGAVESLLLYGSFLFAFDLLDEPWVALRRVQLRGASFITGVLRTTCGDHSLASAALLPIRARAQVLAIRAMERMRRLGSSCPAVARLFGPVPPGEFCGTKRNPFHRSVMPVGTLSRIQRFRSRSQSRWTIVSRNLIAFLFSFPLQMGFRLP